MGIIKKTVFMVLGSLALLLALGFADPGNSRLMTTFLSSPSATWWWPHLCYDCQNKAPPPAVAPKGSAEQAALQRAIAAFNRNLSLAYLGPNPAALMATPMADGLRQNYIEEINFLQRDGRALELTVRDIRIEKVAGLTPLKLSVDTVESVKVRYLKASDRTEIVTSPVASYWMNYTLEKAASGWKILGVETTHLGKRSEQQAE